jgi:tetratricopeptide (TPR) repeat protein
MSEASRSDAAHAHDGAPDADRDAKIEQLLLVGLDHYFAAQYDQAINVWTRALFLDRSHPRARAYIERARSALAERLRQSEELLHNGVDAFQRGEGDEARRLLRAAIDGGAPTDEALAVLDRLDRLETGANAALSSSGTSAPRTRNSRTGVATTWSATAIAAGVLLVGGVLAFGGYAAISRNGPVGPVGVDWQSLLMLKETPAAPSILPVVREQPLPLPGRGEMALNRAKSLAATGHLTDALAALDLVRPTDPQKSEADRLRADVQRQLLALSRQSRVGTPGANPGGRGPRIVNDKRLP